jgi:hypothetical protein
MICDARANLMHNGWRGVKGGTGYADVEEPHELAYLDMSTTSA